MNAVNVDGVTMTEELNLCDACVNDFSNCNALSVSYGTGIGEDNVVDCDTFENIDDVKGD